MHFLSKIIGNKLRFRNLLIGLTKIATDALSQLGGLKIMNQVCYWNFPEGKALSKSLLGTCNTSVLICAFLNEFKD